MKKNTVGLLRFSEKLEKYGKAFSGNLNSKIANEIADEGIEIAEREYNNSGISDVKVYKEQTENGVKIIAESDKIAYIEFGTGEYARGTYQGKLPTQTINFESGGEQKSTQGWEYYYPNPKTKVTYGGKHGWMVGNGIFSTGNIAGNQMYYTAQNLKQKAKDVLIKNIKGGN